MVLIDKRKTAAPFSMIESPIANPLLLVRGLQAIPNTTVLSTAGAVGIYGAVEDLHGREGSCRQTGKGGRGGDPLPKHTPFQKQFSSEDQIDKVTFRI